MSGYSDTGFFIPPTKEEIVQVQFNLYNAFLLSVGIPEISYEQFKTCNIQILLETIQEYDLQSGNTLGLFYPKIVNYVQSVATALQLKPYGCTTVGLYNSLIELEGVNGVSIDEPNRLDSSIDYATMEVAIDGNPDTNDLFQVFLYGVGGGVVTIGDKSVTGGDENGQSRIYYYSDFTSTDLQVKLFFKYDDNYYGNRPQELEIIDLYIQHWKDVYKVGNNLLPAKFNDISYYDGLAYLDSQFSIDGGTTWLTRNEILLSDFNQKYILDEDSITIEQE